MNAKSAQTSFMPVSSHALAPAFTGSLGNIEAYIAEVNRLVKQFGDMKKLMKQLPGMAGGGKRKGLGGLGGMLGKMKLPF